MAASPGYAATPKNGTARIGTANANRDGTGTIGTVATAGANGRRIDALIIQAIATTTAGMVRLFIADDAGSPAIRLIHEEPVIAVTPGTTQPAWAAMLNADNCSKFPLILQAGYALRAATHNAETFDVTVLNGGDL